MSQAEKSIIEKLQKGQDSLKNVIRYYDIFEYGNYWITTLELGTEDLY